MQPGDTRHSSFGTKVVPLKFARRLLAELNSLQSARSSWAVDAHTWLLRAVELVDGRDFELLTTGLKWFDTRANVGGGGSIDLAMHLLQLDFKQAVRKLRRPLAIVNGG